MIGMFVEEKSVSSLIATVVLIIISLIIGGIIADLAVRTMEKGAEQPPLNASFALFPHYLGVDDVTIIMGKGDPVPNAFSGDQLARSPEGALYENLKWLNLELRVNGRKVDNEFIYSFFLLPPGVSSGPQTLDTGKVFSIAFRPEKLMPGDVVSLIYAPTGSPMAEVVVPKEKPTYPVPTFMLGKLIKLFEMRQILLDRLNAADWSGMARISREMRDFLQKEIYPLVEQYLENDHKKMGQLPIVKDAKEIYLVNIAENIAQLLSLEDNFRNYTENLLVAWDPSKVTLVDEDARKRAAENAKKFPILVSDLENRVRDDPVLESMEDLKAVAQYVKIVPMDNPRRAFYYLQIFPYVEGMWRSSDNKEGWVKVLLNIYNMGMVPFEIVRDVGRMWFDNENKWWVSKHFSRVPENENLITVSYEKRLIKKFNLPARSWGCQPNETVHWRIGKPIAGVEWAEDNYPHVAKYGLTVPYSGEPGTNAQLRSEKWNACAGIKLKPGENIMFTYNAPYDDADMENRLAFYEMQVWLEGGEPYHRYEQHQVFWMVGVYNMPKVDINELRKVEPKPPPGGC